MSTEDLLRLAALDFASRLAEIVRTEVAREVRAQLDALHPADPPATREAPTPAKPRGDTPLQRVVELVTVHPGVTPKDVVAELRMSRPTVFKALAEACASGVLSKRGGGRTVQYFAGAGPAEPVVTGSKAAKPVPAQPATTERAAAGAWREVAERAVEFVQANPGCRYGAIQTAVGATTGILQRALRDAKERGVIRMEGTRITARYFAAAAPPAPPPEHEDDAAAPGAHAPAPTESFPTLQHAVAKRALVLVGGTAKYDTLFQIERRYGLSVEWAAAQGDNVAVEAFAERARDGELGAVVILEGLFGPAPVGPIVRALKAHDVPYAYGDRAEAESLHRAFSELEETLLHRQTNDG